MSMDNGGALNWELFPFEEQRPNVRIYPEKERSMLEALVAQQVADLLGTYGSITEIEVDLTGCVITDESKTYQALELDGFLLEDDGELQIHQVPFLHTEPVLDPGCHGISKEDEDGISVFEAVVWDPTTEAYPLVTDTDGKVLDISVLNELFAALVVATLIVANQENTVNQPPLKASDYPIAVSDVDFEAIIALGFSDS